MEPMSFSTIFFLTSFLDSAFAILYSGDLAPFCFLILCIELIAFFVSADIQLH